MSIFLEHLTKNCNLPLTIETGCDFLNSIIFNQIKFILCISRVNKAKYETEIRFKIVLCIANIMGLIIIFFWKFDFVILVKKIHSYDYTVTVDLLSLIRNNSNFEFYFQILVTQFRFLYPIGSLDINGRHTHCNKLCSSLNFSF